MMGSEQNTADHPDNNLPNPGLPRMAGDVVPLHPPGTFSRNTDGGDYVNAVAKGLGMSPPKNVIPFPKK